MPRQSTAFSVVIAGALVCAAVLLHPSAKMEAVRRLVGLGGERLLPAPAVVHRGGSFSFAMTQPGATDPVGWDPCDPVPYAVNPDGMPAGARPLVDRAIARISAATGLAFQDDGDNDRRPFPGQVELGPGDLEGLARAGSLPCG